MAETVCIQLDIKGQVCPSCLLLALKALNEHGQAIRDGDSELIVCTDSRPATNTIPEAANKMGYQVEVERQDDAYRIRIYGRWISTKNQLPNGL